MTGLLAGIAIGLLVAALFVRWAFRSFWEAVFGALIGKKSGK